jgi:hypothetical protein
MGKDLGAPRAYHQAKGGEGQPLKLSVNLSYHPRLEGKNLYIEI